MFSDLLKVLMECPTALRCGAIAAKLNIDTRATKQLLDRCRKEKIPAFAQRKREGYYEYAIGEKKLRPKKQRVEFTLPEDLLRGWISPITGYKPERLGK